MPGPEVKSPEVAETPAKLDYVKPKLTIVPMQHGVRSGPSVS